MFDIFIYGTLCHLPLLKVVLGPEIEGMRQDPACLPGHCVVGVSGADYPTIVSDESAKAEGLLMRGLSEAALARLDFYEGLDGYTRERASVELTDGMLIECEIYAPNVTVVTSGPWRLAEWEAQWGAFAAVQADELMFWMGRAAPEAVAKRMSVIGARAQARLNARQSAPTTLRRKAAAGDFEISDKRVPYASFFSIEEYGLRHLRFDGTRSAQMERGAFVSADAAVVLPYDPKRDRVMLIEQIRVGPIARGDSQPWVLEAIAGRVDAGETPQECAEREALEEAGLALERLISLGGHYPSPGAKSEYLYTFIGIADLPDGVAGLGGVPGEGEDIRAHLLAFDEAMALLESGELNIGPLVITLLHLGLLRKELRQGA